MISIDSGSNPPLPQTAQLEVVRKADDVARDVDLFARFGAEAAIEQNRVVADHRSSTDTGEERIVIRNPAPGVHFFNIGLFSKGSPVSGTITATTSNDTGKLSAIEKRGALGAILR